jgi:hypothetical protein
MTMTANPNVIRHFYIKDIHPCLSVIFMVALLALVSPGKAISEDNTCYLRSRIAELHVSVYNVVPEGTVGIRIWKGVLKEGQPVLLESRFGRIFYEYNTNPDVYSSMVKGLIRYCRNGETVLVP